MAKKKQKSPLKKLSKQLKSSKVQAFLGGVLAAAFGKVLSSSVDFATGKLKSLKKASTGKRHHRDDGAPAYA